MLTVHHSIHDIVPCEWNRLAGTNVFAAHGWLSTAERCRRTPIEPLYFVHRQDSAIVAAAAAYIVSRSRDVETLDHMVFGRLTGVAGAVGLSLLPALVCGPMLGYGWHIGVAPDLSRDNADTARGAILDAMEAAAVARGVELSFPHVMDGERALMRLLDARGYLRCMNVPVAVLEVPWKSFDAYLDDLPGRTRREFRRQINRNRQDGTVIALDDAMAWDEPRLLGLLDDNARKHGGLAFALGPGYFTRLKEHLGADARIFTAVKGGRVTAVLVMLVQGDTGYAIAVGVDQDAAGGDFTYFQIGYNALIGHAIESSLRRLYYGRGMYDVKLRRGCAFENTWVFSRASGARRIATAGWFALASSWNRYKLPARVRRRLAGGAFE